MKRLLGKITTLAMSALLWGAMSLGVNAEVLTENTAKAAVINNYKISITGNVSSTNDPTTRYSAEVPRILTFTDYLGNINVAYTYGGNVVVQRYSKSYAFVDSIIIKQQLPKFGTITSDSNGFYYVVSGQDDQTVAGSANQYQNLVTINVAKYTYDGELAGMLPLKATDQDQGDISPFRSGNCRAVVSKGILNIIFSRTMTSGHQADYMLYVNTSTMLRQDGVTPYSSHSFDQRVIQTSDGGLLVANHGDAYGRNFMISKIMGKTTMRSIAAFHFREGSNRDGLTDLGQRQHGYNETYAQLGSLVETGNAYAYVASSERTLSLDVSPAKGYCGYAEARDLFVQILKKDFYNYSGAACYYADGEIRRPTGTKPEKHDTVLYLDGTETDYGVLWLTAYDNAHFAANPQAVSIGDGKIAILWEKREYKGNSVETYYAIIDESGKIVENAVKIPNTMLVGDGEPLYVDGKIVWATSDAYGARINVLSLEEVKLGTFKMNELTNTKTGVKVTWKECKNAAGYNVWRKVSSGKYEKIAVTDGNVFEYLDTKATEGKTYSYKVEAFYGNVTKACKAAKKIRRMKAVTIKSVTNVSGKKMKVTYAKYSKGNGYEIQYSTKSNFSNAKSAFVDSYKTTSKKISGLKSGKKYYVRIRSVYETSSGTEYYGAWSSTKKVKISK